jgi:signal transduction histidine kinase
MLHEFLTTYRDELIGRCKAKAMQRSIPNANGTALDHGIPVFLDQLIRTLRIEQTSEPMRSRRISGSAGGETRGLSEIGETAARHGRELLQSGFPVEAVVHAYGDLCQSITDLAFELSAPVTASEFRTLNRCLDNAIAEAVTEFSYQREARFSDSAAHAMHERLGCLAHELRNHIQTATLALNAIKTGNVGLGGATGAVLDRSIVGLSNLIDRSLTDSRVIAGLPAQIELLRLADLIDEATSSATLESQARGCSLAVNTVDPALAVAADRDLFMAALGNLLQNAIKFTKPHTEVSLQAYSAGSRIVIDIEDRCGGLPEGDTGRMFLPFVQENADKSGLGLGLSICRRSVETMGGLLKVRNIPGAGCVFTLSLPRRALATDRNLKCQAS